MRRLRATRWARDAGVLLLGLAAAALVAVFFAVVVNAIQGRVAAERIRDDTATAARRRIDQLNGEISSLSAQATVNGQHLGELLAEVATLQEQVRQLGGKPVVVNTGGSTTVNTAPPATTTATTRPPPTTTTTRPKTCTTLPILGRCA